MIYKWTSGEIRVPVACRLVLWTLIVLTIVLPFGLFKWPEPQVEE